MIRTMKFNVRYWYHHVKFVPRSWRYFLNECTNSWKSVLHPESWNVKLSAQCLLWWIKNMTTGFWRKNTFSTDDHGISNFKCGEIVKHRLKAMRIVLPPCRRWCYESFKPGSLRILDKNAGEFVPVYMFLFVMCSG